MIPPTLVRGPTINGLRRPLSATSPSRSLGGTPEGALRFRLPRYAPLFYSTVRGVVSEHETHLDTFFIDADQRRVELVWRASVPLPRKTEHLEKVVIYGSEPLPERVMAHLAAGVFGEGPTEAQ